MPDHDVADSPGALRSYLELLRLPNIFTAMADVAMGFLFLGGGPDQVPGAWSAGGELTRQGYWLLGLLVASSSLLYAAGVVLNDVFDLATDRQERPCRPLPSGRISLRTARWLGGEMLLIGTFLPCAMAWSLRQPRLAAVAVALAAAIVLYDRFLKRTPLGPLAMGSCRMLNVLLGMSVLRGPLEPQHWLVAAAVGVYVMGVTWFARQEVLRSDRRQLAGAAVVMMAGVALLVWLPHWPQSVIPAIQLDPWRWWYLMIGLLGAAILARCLWAIAEPSPGRVRVAVAQAILSLVVLDAAVTYAARGFNWALLIVLLSLLPAALLGRWIEST
ncbi:MAG: UbiA family prenyltransferase [Thermoguttaceae bacterium]|jgi:4-hydroxybenzoate polyprenyltransferase